MRITRIILGLSFVFLLASLSVIAQTTSNIEGTVKDPRGAVVAGAQIKVASPSLAVERGASSDENGFYRITALPAGTYTLTASGAGFANTTLGSVELTANRTLTLDVQLEVGKVQEQVDVTAETQLIDSTSSATGTTVIPRQITEFPVNGRNYLDLLQLVPGVAINRQSSGDNANPVLGERSGNNNFFIDGQPNFFRVLWVPARPRFGSSSSLHPALDAAQLGVCCVSALYPSNRSWS